MIGDGRILPSQSERIAAYLGRRAGPVSSRTLTLEFLAMSIDSEALATKLVAPMMESAGARYDEASGWSLREPAGAASPCPPMVAAAVDPDSGDVSLADPQGGAVPSLEGAIVVMMTPSREAKGLRAWALRQGVSQPVSIVTLRSAARRLLGPRGPRKEVRFPRDADLPVFCGLLGVRWLDTGDAAGSARAIAACLAELAARGDAAEMPAADAGSGDAAPAPALPAGITKEMLAALPRAPGIYRFYDAAGALIYAGKARDLRQRISSYFHAGAVRVPRRFYANIHRFEFTLAGTDLDALLGEARLIARRRPEGNVQVKVHERAASYTPARACALLLPRSDRRGVTAIVVRDGKVLGRVSLGPRGGGLAAARKWIGLAVCPGRGVHVASARAAADSEILGSWLARHGESVCRLDLDGFKKAGAAMKALREAVVDLLSGGGVEPVVYR